MNATLFKKHWSSFCRHLKKHGINGIQKIEFQKGGQPHIHLLIDKDLTSEDKEELAFIWRRILGILDTPNRRYSFNASRIKNRDDIIPYLAKRKQTQPPETFGPVGRYWSVFGKPEKIAPICIEGTVEEMAPLVRIVRNYARRKHEEWKETSPSQKKRMAYGLARRDNGRVGFTCWNISLLLLPCLPTLLRLLGIGEH